MSAVRDEGREDEAMMEDAGDGDDDEEDDYEDEGEEGERGDAESPAARDNAGAGLADREKILRTALVVSPGAAAM
jgi:hypothetical protein